MNCHVTFDVATHLLIVYITNAQLWQVKQGTTATTGRSTNDATYASSFSDRPCLHTPSEK
jgi:hypothetical protein